MTQSRIGDGETVVDFIRKHPDILDATLADLKKDRRRRTRSGRLNAVGLRELIEVFQDESRSSDARASAARELAEDAANISGPVVAEAIRSRSPLVRDETIRGLQRGLWKKRPRRSFRVAVSEALRALLERKSGPGDIAAAECLSHLDHASASEILTSRQWLSMSNPHLVDLLQLLARLQAIAPAARLLPLLQASRSRFLTYPHKYIFGNALLLLAMSDALLAREWIDQVLSLPKIRTRAYADIGVYAARALLMAMGMADFWKRLANQAATSGLDGLNPAQRNAYCALAYYYDADSGGLSQFFWNMDTDQIRATPAALRVIGAPGEAELLRNAIKMFKPKSWLLNREHRRELLASEGGSRLIDQLDKRSKRAFEPIEMLAMLYVARRPAQFSL